MQNENKTNFLVELASYQITAREFFSMVLLDSIQKNFGTKEAVISYFDVDGNFLSWTSFREIALNGPSHPYGKFITKDIVRNLIYREAVRDNLTYFDVAPRLYKASDVIGVEDYENSAYVRFIEKNFESHYSVTLAFGINAYIQVTFFKTKEEGDFSESELKDLEDMYIYVANAYKNFKKYEQSKIVQDIQNQVIQTEAKAYLVTDDFMHIMSYNTQAKEYLAEIIGEEYASQLDQRKPCDWLPFLLGNRAELKEKEVKEVEIKGKIFRIYTFDQKYSNGIVDRYHWITIQPREEKRAKEPELSDTVLTPTEKKVANYLYKGYTYKAIAEEMVISLHTVKKHVENIYLKCQVKGRYELCRWMDEKK